MFHKGHYVNAPLCHTCIAFFACTVPRHWYSSSVARGGQGGQLPPLFSRNVRGIPTLVEEREVFNDLSVTKESEKLIIKLLFTSRRPPERPHTDSVNNAHRLL